jgi:two-component system, cell cycle sensor histidine kinase and response regulator CckA
VVVASRWMLLRNSQGIPHSILAIDAEITEKRQMEAQLRTQRLEIIGTLAGGMAGSRPTSINILQVIVSGASLSTSGVLALHSWLLYRAQL